MPAFSLRSLVTPAGLLYDKSHSWTFMEKDGTVRVGIDDFLQHVTGSITRVVMKFPGDKIRKGDQVLSVIQNGKKLDIKSPVSGTIVTRNERLNSDTGLINSSPYDEGWVYAIEPDNWEKESRFMIIAGRYIEYLKEEFARIRDFLAVMPGVNDVRYAHVVLQDGGEFKEGLLEEFGPEVWEEFQNRFLDVPR
jgi:glycine cleavage system H lipoate-binding protein